MKLLSFYLLITCSFANAQSLPAITLEKDIIERLGLVSAPVGKHVVADPVMATAQTVIDPARARSVATFFSGHVDRDLVQLGEEVKVNQDLVQLRSREVAEVISAFLEASSKFETASLLYERERKLHGKKLTTDEAFLNAKAAHQEALATRTATMQTALLVRSRDDLMSMLEGDGSNDFTHLQILSPMSGMVIEKKVYAGDPVESNHQLFKVADLSQLLVEIQLPLKAVSMVKVGDVLGFNTVIGGKKTGMAQVSLISPVVNQLSLRVLAVLDNAEGTWRAGTPLSVRVIDSSAQKVTAAPASAIVSIEGKPHLFTEEENGRFQPIALSTGKRSQEFIEITEGPGSDVQIVVKGASLLLAAWEERVSE